MDAGDLSVFTAVARSGGINRAAQALNTVQSNVTQRIRVLERELGVPLFHRVGRRVVPTEAARALANCADRVFDDIAATLAVVSGPESTLGGSLRICSTETVTDNVLPAALAELRRRFPACHVQVEMLGTDDAIQRVLADEFDLAIVVLPVVDARLEVQRLLEEDVLLAVSPAHRWASAGRVPVSEALAEAGFVLSMPGLGLRAMVDEAVAREHVPMQASFELRSQQAILSLVASGAGVAFSPAMSLAGRDDIVGVPLDPPLRREVGWIKRPGRHQPRIALELLELVSGN
jgi:DNA-binding transcriptional LysR family regulator